MSKAALPFLLLAACASDPGDYVQAAESCISDQVDPNSRLSAAEAREVVANCQPQIDRWAVEGLQKRLGENFDANDPSIVQEIGDRRQVIEDRFLTKLSDQIQSRTVVM